MKKILMMLVLTPMMAMTGESAAVTNACDTSRNPRPVAAFRGCAALSSITMPDSVTFIGDIAFEHCPDLTSVAMRGVRPISSANAFGKCKKLKVIHVPVNSKSWAGLKEWQGVPLAFDGEPLDPLKEKELMDAVQRQLAEESARQEKAKAKREAVRADQKKKLLEIQEKMKRIRAVRSNQETAPQ